ncbi:MAG: hypothetical protein WCS65_17545 [Verrucomicrobiae bacterium]
MRAATASAKSTVIDVTEFVHRGRKRRIFRREAQGNFYIRKEIGGKALWKCLDSPLARIATTNAHAWLDALQLAAADGKWERLDPVRSKTPWASIGEILACYIDRAPAAGQIDQRSANGNASSLRSLLRAATACEDPDLLRADILTEATARTYLEKTRAGARSESGIRSTLVQARSVFAPSLLYIYAGMRLPDLKGFRVAIRFDTGADVGFVPFAPEMIAKMESAALALRQCDPATWHCYMLMSRLGMRNIEVERATLGWLRPDDEGHWHLDIPETKDGLARHLQLPDDLSARVIREIAGDGPHLIPARNITERSAICQREINRFAGQFITDRSKTAYELRKWAGSLVWSTQGSEAAQYFLGHRSIATTERYYARFLRPVRAVSAADRASIYGQPAELALEQDRKRATADPDPDPRTKPRT